MGTRSPHPTAARRLRDLQIVMMPASAPAYHVDPRRYRHDFRCAPRPMSQSPLSDRPGGSRLRPRPPGTHPPRSAHSDQPARPSAARRSARGSGSVRPSLAGLVPWTGGPGGPASLPTRCSIPISGEPPDIHERKCLRCRADGAHQPAEARRAARLTIVPKPVRPQNIAVAARSRLCWLAPDEAASGDERQQADYHRPGGEPVLPSRQPGHDQIADLGERHDAPVPFWHGPPASPPSGARPPGRCIAAPTVSTSPGIGPSLRSRPSRRSRPRAPTIPRRPVPAVAAGSAWNRQPIEDELNL